MRGENILNYLHNMEVISSTGSLVRSLEPRYDRLFILCHLLDLVLLSDIVLEARDFLEGQAENVRHENHGLIHPLREHDQVKVLIHISRNLRCELAL